MRCYYEVLGVPQSSDDAAIKKAYRLQALEWHPDKNQHRLDEADEKFKEISNAYEVLSDQHERAWYDSHRDQILAADSHQAGSWSFSGGGVRPADEEDLFSYFSARCYSGYGDDKKGFYALYEALFEKLVQQEVRAAEKRGKCVPEDLSNAPRFGQASATWAQVAAFYDHFLGFATLKDFAWADEHNPAAAPNRKVRRLIEDENTKRRKALRRHYNETVRELATFVRKRDKRVLAHNAEEAAKRAAREAEVSKKRQEEKAARAAAAAEWREADWVTANDQAADTGDESDEAQELIDWHCVICDKLFRSEKALANHERSKKHLEKLAEMRDVLQAEESQANGIPVANDTAAATSAAQPEADGIETGAADAAPSEAESEGPPAPRLSKKQQKKKQKKWERQRAAVGGAPAAEPDREAEPDAQPARDANATDGTGSERSASGAGELGKDDMLAAMMQSATLRREQPGNAGATADGDSEGWSEAGSGNGGAEGGAGSGQSDEDGATSQSASSRRRQPPDKAAVPEGQGGAAAVGSDDGGGSLQNGVAKAEAAPQGKQPKGKRRRAKKGGAAPEQQAAKQPDLVCSVCQQEFGSRTKLFAHISQTGHARPKAP